MWFEGHWGFQYYMQQWGAIAFDRRNHRQAVREQVVVCTLAMLKQIMSIIAFAFAEDKDHAKP